MLFYFFPRFIYDIPEQAYFIPAIEILEIPITRQKPHNTLPPPSKPIIPIGSDNIEILSDVSLNTENILSSNDSTAFGDFLSDMPLSFRPKQILEVIPQNVDKDIKGEVILQLKINADGKVSNYRIVKNSTNSNQCIDSAIRAAKRSIWESAIINNRPVEYWIEKIYKFNK